MNEIGKHITHSGVVESVEGNKVTVKILNASACSGCHAKGACTVADTEEKYIDIENISAKYNVGEEVTVELDQSNGLRAVFFAYFLPFLIVMGVLITLTILEIKEWKAGLISLLTLVPYYIVLKQFSNTFKKRFKFRIKN